MSTAPPAPAIAPSWSRPAGSTWSRSPGWTSPAGGSTTSPRRTIPRSGTSIARPPRLLAPAAAPGAHSYQLPPEARWAIHTWSRFDRPPVVDLVRLPGHQVVRTFVDDTAQRAAVVRLTPRPAEFFRVPVSGGVTLDGWMIRPPGFDSTKSYPLLMYVYGEPAGQTVMDAWQGRTVLWHRMLAQQGYVVASVDTRGTPAPRGRAWRKVIYGAVGVIGSREQAEAVRQLTRSRPWLDSTRVAIWGWRGGGSSTLQAMFRYPDVYQVGMAVAPVPDQSLYDTIYQERYMGLPTPNADG